MSRDPLNMIADRLKILRKEWGITQEVAAKQCHLSAMAISHFENGRREPSARNLCKLVYGYHTSADYILGIAPRNEPFMVSWQRHPDAVFEDKAA